MIASGRNMNPNAFIGKINKPTKDEWIAALGPGRAIWDQLIADFSADYGVDIQEWNSHSPKAGWSLRLKHKERTIAYLSPCQGCFRIAFVLGDKAVAAARQSNLPARIIKIIDESRRYAEGTGIRLTINKIPDIAIARNLAAIKLAN